MHQWDINRWSIPAPCDDTQTLTSGLIQLTGMSFLFLPHQANDLVYKSLKA